MVYPLAPRVFAKKYLLAFFSFSTYPDGLIEADTTDTTGIYKPRNPQQTILYRVVQQNLETWLTARREADPDAYPIPNYVESAFRKYLQCGIWAYGFARVRCPSCGYEFLVSFSCKTRGLCPSCNAKYMAQTTAHLVDNVLPFVPFRQVVLTVPKRIRFFLRIPFFLQNARHKRGIQRIFLRALETAIRKASPGAPKHSRFGAVVFTHRSGIRTSNGSGLPSDTWARGDRRLCRSSVKYSPIFSLVTPC